MASINSEETTVITITMQLSKSEAAFLRPMFQNPNGSETAFQAELRRQMFVALGGQVPHIGENNGN